MKIDENLILTILDLVERKSQGSGHTVDLAGLGFDPRVVGYHLEHLHRGGLIVGQEMIEEDDAGQFSYYEPSDLTPAGRAYLARLRAR